MRFYHGWHRPYFYDAIYGDRGYGPEDVGVHYERFRDYYSWDDDDSDW